MKLKELLDVIDVDVMIGIIDLGTDEFVFNGYAMDADEESVPEEILTGYVASIFNGDSEKYDTSGINIMVDPSET